MIWKNGGPAQAASGLLPRSGYNPLTKSTSSQNPSAPGSTVDRAQPSARSKGGCLAGKSGSTVNSRRLGYAKAAPFTRNDAMLASLPIGVMDFAGAGIQDNFVDKARRRGIQFARRRVSAVSLDAVRSLSLDPHMSFYPRCGPGINPITINNFSPLEHQITACNPKCERKMLFDDDQ
jgi:hypothetical protein